MGDREIVLREYAVNIINVLRNIGDVAIQFAPPPASTAWSAVKVLMQVRLQAGIGIPCNVAKIYRFL